jgi:hypothetical protein
MRFSTPFRDRWGRRGALRCRTRLAPKCSPVRLEEPAEPRRRGRGLKGGPQRLVWRPLFNCLRELPGSSWPSGDRAAGLHRLIGDFVLLPAGNARPVLLARFGLRRTTTWSMPRSSMTSTRRALDLRKRPNTLVRSVALPKSCLTFMTTDGFSGGGRAAAPPMIRQWDHIRRKHHVHRWTCRRR